MCGIVLEWAIPHCFLKGKSPNGMVENLRLDCMKKIPLQSSMNATVL